MSLPELAAGSDIADRAEQQVTTSSVERDGPLGDGSAVTRGQRLALQRVELPISGLPCPGDAGALAMRLERTAGIKEAMVNPVTDRVVVVFDPGSVGLEDVVRALEAEGLEVGHSVARWRLGIPGLKCPSCVSMLEESVRRVRGVREVWVNLDRETITVEYSPRRTDVGLVTDAVNSVGFDIVPPTGAADRGETRGQRGELGDLPRRLASATALAVPVAALSHPSWFGLQGAVTQNGLWQAAFWIAAAVLSLMGVLYPGAHLYRGAWTALKNRATNANTLVVLAVSVAWLHSAAPLIGSQVGIASAPGSVFFEVPVLVMALLLLGQVLEHQLQIHQRDWKKARRGRVPGTVRVTRGGRVVAIPFEEIVPGDMVWVHPHEQLPVDGVVVEGNSMVDESQLTRVRPLRAKTPGDEVYASSVNETGVLGVRAVAVGKETMSARLLAVASAARDSKSAAQRRMDRIATHLTPAAAIASILAFLAWYNLGPQPALAYATTALVGVLLMVSPRGLGVAASAATAAGLRKASARGLLLRSANVMDALGGVDTVVLSDPYVATTTGADVAVKSLRRMGLGTVLMATRDPVTSPMLGRQLGVDRMIVGLSRAEQEEVVRQMRRGGKRVAVIGSGVRRGGPLAEASVGIAMGKLTEVVGAPAHVILLRADLTAVVEALRLARATRRTIRQNILAIYTYNALALPLAGAVLAPAFGMPLAPVVAAGAAAAVSLGLVANASRLSRASLGTDGALSG